MNLTSTAAARQSPVRTDVDQPGLVVEDELQQPIKRQTHEQRREDIVADGVLGILGKEGDEKRNTQTNCPSLRVEPPGHMVREPHEGGERRRIQEADPVDQPALAQADPSAHPIP